MSNQREIQKQLENLFSWADFYKQNQRWTEWAKTQDQIDAFKNKHGLNN